MIFDAPPPAIIIPRPAPEFRAYLNNEDAGHAIPRDFLAMPPVLRQTVSVTEIRSWLPEPFRMLGEGMLLSMFGGWPGPLMAGGIKAGWLFTGNGTFTVPGDWNREDNAVHGVGRGGGGANAVESQLIDNDFYGGGGGGGGGYSGLSNRPLTVGDQFSVTVGGDTGFGSLLLARAGGNAGSVSGGSSSGGGGGQANSGIGDTRTSGGNGTSRSGSNYLANAGGGGGGAGGPNGNGASAPGFDGGTADAGQGGAGGVRDFNNGPRAPGSGVSGPSGGWAPGIAENAGSGGGGSGGMGDSSGNMPLAWAAGIPGAEYGGGGGGGGASRVGIVGGSQAMPGAPGAPGVLLIVNNPSL